MATYDIDVKHVETASRALLESTISNKQLIGYASGTSQLGYYAANGSWVYYSPGHKMHTSGGTEAVSIDSNGSLSCISSGNFTGSMTIGAVENQVSDPDKFLCIDGSGVVKYRTGAEVSSDISVHDAVTVSDTSSVNLTLAGQQISAEVVPSGVSHSGLANLNTSNYYHLTQANHTDLTDSGDSSLHYHASDRVWSNQTGTPTTVSGYGITDAISPSGSPLDNQIAVFTDGNTIEGSANLTHDGTDTVLGGTLTIGTVANEASDPDKFLCVDGSGVVKYRTGAEVLSDIGAGTGSVDTSGTPVDNQVAVFTDADTIEGSANLTHDGTDTVLGGTLTIPDYIIHAGDTDTYFGYNANNSFVAQAGGITGLRVASNEVEINPNAEDQDFVVNWDSGEALIVDGATGDVDLSQDLDMTGAGAVIAFSGTHGGNGEGFVYEDSGGTERNFLRVISDVVTLCNRASNGTVEIRANSATAGPAGESTIATFEDDAVGIAKAPTLATLDVNGDLALGTVTNETSDPDKFLCVDGSGVVKYRTGAEVLSDIGAGTGSVDTSGTPVDNQVAVFVDADTIEGSSSLTFDSQLYVYRNATMGALTSPTAASAVLRIEDASNTMYLDGNSILSDGLFWLSTSGGYDLQFGTNDTLRMDIDGTSGDVGIVNNLNVDGYVHSKTALHLTGSLLGGQTPGTDGSTIEVDDSGDGDLDFINREQDAGFRFVRAYPEPDETVLEIGTDNNGTDVYTVAKYDYSGSSTINGWSGTPTSEIYCKRVGNTCHVWFKVTGTGTGTAFNTVNFTVPWQNDTDDSALGVAKTVQDGGATVNMSYCEVGDNSSTVYVYVDADQSAWTNSVSRYIKGYLCYETNAAL